MPHGVSFNYSIWFVELKGVVSWNVVHPAHKWLTKYREKEAVRLCLKHFRQHNYSEAFESLQKKTRVSLEHPLLTKLHKTLVEAGSYEETENCIKQDCENGLFDSYLNSQECKPIWKLINPVTEVANQLRPGMRGGHQMCMDVLTETIYLFGGWDGTQDLADFWSFHIPTQKWTLISSNTAEDGGPSARSCHKMTLDQERRQIFTLGRYVDSSTRTPEKLKSDFYLYDLNTGRWTLITDDTSGMGGPRLIFDHQMVMDVTKRVLYVFGGRVLTSSALALDTSALGSQSSLESASDLISPITSVAPPTSQLTQPTVVTASSPVSHAGSPSSRAPSSTPGRLEYLFSGLYSYDVPTNTWTLLREDAECSSPSDGADNRGTLRSRIGHSMLFHPVQRKLFIFAGQRAKEYLNDFLTYDVDSDRVTVVNSKNDDTKKIGGTVEGPVAGSASSPGGFGESERDEVVSKEYRHSSPYIPTPLPAAGFTQRATIDPDLDEIHVLSGLSKDKDKREENVKNSFWVFSIPSNRWSCVYKNENQSAQYWDKMLDKEPCPRFAHQLVFDHIRKVHYLFGGNPGKTSLPKMRLDDFWALRLMKPSKAQVLKKCVYLIRKHQFLEMVHNCPLEATAFLQTKVSAVVNHESEEERKQFHLLASRLFAPSSPSKDDNSSAASAPPQPAVSSSGAVPATAAAAFAAAMFGGGRRETVDADTDSALDVDDDWRHRTELFDLLVAFYPENMTQPKHNLVDLIQG